MAWALRRVPGIRLGPSTSIPNGIPQSGRVDKYRSYAVRTSSLVRLVREMAGSASGCFPRHPRSGVVPRFSHVPSDPLPTSRESCRHLLKGGDDLLVIDLAGGVDSALT